MKKILVTILTVAMMTSAVAAFADGGPQGDPMGGPMDGQPPRMEQGQQAPEKPAEGQAPTDGQAPSDGQHTPGTDIRMIDFDVNHHMLYFVILQPFQCFLACRTF